MPAARAADTKANNRGSGSSSAEPRAGARTGRSAARPAAASAPARRARRSADTRRGRRPRARLPDAGTAPHASRRVAARAGSSAARAWVRRATARARARATCSNRASEPPQPPRRARRRAARCRLRVCRCGRRARAALLAASGGLAEAGAQRVRRRGSRALAAGGMTRRLGQVARVEVRLERSNALEQRRMRREPAAKRARAALEQHVRDFLGIDGGDVARRSRRSSSALRRGLPARA